MSLCDVSLRSMNLNALLALDALLRTGGVTAAARELGITQPAMSHQLASLRELLNDPLLVRVGGRMTLTPRARALAEPLGECLGELSRLLDSQREFDASTTEQVFRISVGQHMGLSLVPRLMACMRQAAPHARFEVRELRREELSEALGHGRTDLAIGVAEGLHAGIVSRPWLDDRFLCALRVGHPVLQAPLSAEGYAALGHVVVSPTGRGASPVDLALAERGLRRHVALRVDSFLIAPEVVAGTDLVITAPASSLRPWVDRRELVTFEPPVALEPSTSVHVMWHEGRNTESAHRWLREQLLSLRDE